MGNCQYSYCTTTYCPGSTTKKLRHYYCEGTIYYKCEC